MPHRRHNPLTGDWVLVSPQRQKRPWRGTVEAPPAPALQRHDPDCPLCPRNRRGGSGAVNPDYTGVFVFDNDYPALTPEAPAAQPPPPSPFARSRPARGACRVICFSPRHDLTLSQLPPARIEAVVAAWRAQYADLIGAHRWVQIFENKGAMMGCSNPHPHGQIWAGDFVPNELRREGQRQLAHHRAHGAALLDDYMAFEMRAGERVVAHNEHWAAVVPYWAVWPFETLLLPRRAVCDFDQVDDQLQAALAALLKNLLGRYDRLFGCPMPYCLGWHGAPGKATAAARAAWRLHAHCYPPLLRGATVRKHMVGYEMLCEPQRDLTPEDAAARLRDA
ncbi:MAG: UDP-glucose--hexose-1-phosphate uridylyltransferase [Gammaproteobacteria bacterium]|nr:UDP-glucose--hexose-1-phosphate uridylyltransferase [Gammaproteobacteria bacterium]